MVYVLGGIVLCQQMSYIPGPDYEVRYKLIIKKFAWRTKWLPLQKNQELLRWYIHGNTNWSTFRILPWLSEERFTNIGTMWDDKIWQPSAMQRLRGFRGPRIYIAKLVSGMTSKDWGKMVNNAGGVISDMLDVLASVTIHIVWYRGFSNITKLINIRTEPINWELT